MKVKLGLKGSQYVPLIMQADYAVTWLGIVEVNGVKGALSLNNMTGHYLQHVSARAAHVLDPLEVLAAIEAATATGKTSANPMGRPLAYGAKLEQYGVALPPSHVDYARTIGGGNLSEGVRRCLEFCIVNKFER